MIYQNFAKTLNYQVKNRNLGPEVLIIAFESHKKEYFDRKACHKAWESECSIYGSMPRTTDFEFKNRQKFLYTIA